MNTAFQQFHRRIRDGIDSLCVGRLTCTADKPISITMGRHVAWIDPVEAISTATALLEAARAPISVIRWIKTNTGAGLPDDDETVFLCDEEGEIWMGYMDAGQWRGIDAMPLSWAPVAWASMSKGVKP